MPSSQESRLNSPITLEVLERSFATHSIKKDELFSQLVQIKNPDGLMVATYRLTSKITGYRCPLIRNSHQIQLNNPITYLNSWLVVVNELSSAGLLYQLAKGQPFYTGQFVGGIYLLRAQGAFSRSDSLAIFAGN